MRPPLALALLATFLLAACGNRGSLVLPPKPAQPTPPTAAAPANSAAGAPTKDAGAAAESGR